MKLDTKYNIGDVVYAAGVRGGERKTTCPDCLGQRAWQCHTPAGEDFYVPCGTCYSAWASTGYLTSYCTDPRVERLTIGSVQYDSHGNEIRYMCRETGVGSGTLWHEDSLFVTEGEAMTAAVALAAAAEVARLERNKETSERAKREPRRKPKKVTP